MKDIYITQNSKLELYKRLAIKRPNNLIVQFLYRMKSFLPTKEQEKKESKLYLLPILGNSVDMEYSSRDQTVSVKFNGKQIFRGYLGSDTLFAAIEALIIEEVNGYKTVFRMKGRSLLKDRLEITPKALNKIGVKMSPRLNSLLKRFGAITKKGGYNSSVLYKREFIYFKRLGKIRADEYFQCGNKFIRKNLPVFLLNNSLNRNNFEELLARVPGFLEFYEDALKSSRTIYYVIDSEMRVFTLRKGKLKLNKI